MAKKKIAEVSEEQVINPEVVAEEIQAPEETKIEEAEAPEEETEAEEVKAPEEEAISETTVKVDELPDHVKAVFKLYPEAEALYVDVKGGVYSADSKPSMVGSAILYKNPLYKS